MLKPAICLMEKFNRRVSALGSTRKKIEGVLSSGLIRIRDAETVYAGLFLDAFTNFEIFLERLFLGILSGQVRAHAKRLLKVSPTSKTKDVLFVGKQYLDWLPYKDKTIERASCFLLTGDPSQIWMRPRCQSLTTIMLFEMR